MHEQYESCGWDKDGDGKGGYQSARTRRGKERGLGGYEVGRTCCLIIIIIIIIN